MLSKKEFLKEEKECADMLGLTIEQYRRSLKNVKLGTSDKKSKKEKYDNSILEFFGIDESMLKKKKCN